MTDKIEPVLTAEEWRGKSILRMGAWLQTWVKISTDADFVVDVMIDSGEEMQCGDVSLSDPARLALIAVCNAALPADDPRKITRETIALLRTSEVHAPDCDLLTALTDYGPVCDCAVAAKVKSLADALESYLPPEKPA